jgi:hypothetical protein
MKDVEKLADNHVESLGFITFANDYSNERRKSFIDGYNKAKETLYTEEDIKKAFEAGHTLGVYLSDYKHDEMYQEFLKSIKKK